MFFHYFFSRYKLENDLCEQEKHMKNINSLISNKNCAIEQLSEELNEWQNKLKDLIVIFFIFVS